MSKIPTPALMFGASFTSATATWLLERWISLLSGQALDPSAVFAGMGLSALIASISVLFSRYA